METVTSPASVRVITDSDTHTVKTHTVKTVIGSWPAVKYAVEAIGTFYLVLTVGAAVSNPSPLSPLIIGAVLIVMIYAGGDVSAAHCNPAVTLALLLRRWIGIRDAAGYWTVQLGAGLFAAVVVRAIVNPARLANTAALTPGGPILIAALAIELLVAFALCYAVLNTVAPKGQPSSWLQGMTIGLAMVASAALVGAISAHAGAISGEASNPQTTAGAALTQMGALTQTFGWPTWWVYLVAQIITCTAAGVAFLKLSPDDAHRSRQTP